MAQLSFGSLGKDASAVAVVMAGGSGTRFWPLSRKSRPKQFLPLAGGSKSLIQVTAERLAPLVGPRGTLIVAAEHQSKLVMEHLPSVSVLLEPLARNTAPCIGFAAVRVLYELGDVPMLCLPADHVIHGDKQVLQVYRDALDIASESDVLVTIGIKPTSPETGYGYIERGDSYESGELCSACHVKRFVEKPDKTTAERYLKSGDYFWNSGMFAWRPSVILGEIKEHLPDTARALEKIAAAFGTEKEYEEGFKWYSEIESVSIDYGVLERAAKVVMVPGNGFEWSDVGSWTSWSENISASEADEKGNVVRGDAIVLDSNTCTIVGDSKLIVGVGIEDLIIVDTEDALLVCRKDRSQDVKTVVQMLKDRQREELL